MPGERWLLDSDQSSGADAARLARFGAHLRLTADGFDAKCFNVSEGEAVYVDPQHRMLLMSALQASAASASGAGSLGLTSVDVDGANTSTGVAIGISGNEYAQMTAKEPLSPYTAPGGFMSVACGRAVQVDSPIRLTPG